MYWYHPHVHGNTTTQVDGGAAGAFIIEGSIQGTQGLPERVLVIRQQFDNPNSWLPGPNQLTINYQPAIYPTRLRPSSMFRMARRNSGEWWTRPPGVSRFAGAVWNDSAQLEVVALDGIPLTTPIYETTINLPPAGRAEFIVPGLPVGQTGTFLTTGFNTGPVGNPNSEQPLANIIGSGDGKVPHPATHRSSPGRSSAFRGTRGPGADRYAKPFLSEQTIGTNGPTHSSSP